MPIVLGAGLVGLLAVLMFAVSTGGARQAKPAPPVQLITANFPYQTLSPHSGTNGVTLLTIPFTASATSNVQVTTLLEATGLDSLTAISCDLMLDGTTLMGVFQLNNVSSPGQPQYGGVTATAPVWSGPHTMVLECHFLRPSSVDVTLFSQGISLIVG
jgi:hypothetical protein